MSTAVSHVKVGLLQRQLPVPSASSDSGPTQEMVMAEVPYPCGRQCGARVLQHNSEDLEFLMSLVGGPGNASMQNAM